MKLLNQTLKKIGTLNKESMKKTRQRIDNLIKPLGSLGKIEDIAVKLAGITGNTFPTVDNKVVIVMSADHGVYEEGVAPDPQILTAIQTPNFAKGVTGVCAFAKQARADVIVVDIGVATDINDPRVINRKIRYGTSNMAKGPAMTREEAIKSLEIGIEITASQIKEGKNLIGTGEMGISNTTSSTAIFSAIGKLDPIEIVGIGAGLPVEKLSHKANVIKKAIEINQPNPKDGIDVLAKVGGFEIGGMAGVFLGAAAHKVPVVVDGFISTAAALIAITIEPKVKDFLIPSHHTAEKGGQVAYKLVGLEPMFDMGLRLGEGSGAALAFNFIEAATYMLKEMITYKEAGIIL
ncbi:nicotinate-nucleotide--dimethylbenzimidazole phosphoribosyltransferase [Crassaminicella thermophila]|uniref:Nicotinate-nucleotide--dimethylbenzimidazole phosphoribosyltransferase n=1 Tax=Crassaminicella thermophila TaxID=2599308 RepID=A0A5C0SIQ6_CRATE|nr:nicotinate-nucleotide--dimethylbenzimidazole phosphoribosyltransferase [Crassaminicella thermophila]QEK13098.1 nicotinate-nucleotide--dimethylbenzimidazole phosphoribosyltransferase [Crassaminicella thermophila]